MDDKKNRGELFDEKLMKQIRERFLHVEEDPVLKEKRLFFDNAGGSIRLKAANEAFKKVDEMPDCPEHSNKSALELAAIQAKGTEDVLRVVFNAKTGSLVTSLTASMAIFEMTRAIIENVPGTNVVTTKLEHPSAYDAVVLNAQRCGKEIRVADTNKRTGGVDVEAITKLIDMNTCLLSVIYASNISGAVNDMEKIVKEARKIKPDLYILCDSVQHVPHKAVDIDKLHVDGLNFAPYKFFGPRGMGFGYLSERAAKLPHNKLLAKPSDVWELGSPAPAHFAAITEVVNYVCWIGGHFVKTEDRRKLYEEGMNRINLHERALLHHVLNGSDKVEGLRKMKGVKVFLDYEDLSTRDLIIAMGIDNLDPKKAVAEYEKEGVVAFERVSTSIYSARMLNSFEIEGCIRVSPLHCNTVDEMDRFLMVTKKLADKYNPR